MEVLVNHPVHITNKNTASVFIPFCSFGDKETSGNFQDSSCSLFREKVVDGQLCYEADAKANRFRNGRFSKDFQLNISKEKFSKGLNHAIITMKNGKKFCFASNS